MRPVRDLARATRLPAVGRAAVGMTVVTTGLALRFGTVPRAGTALVLELVALASFSVVFLVERRTPFLRRGVVCGGAAVLLVLAVALPPQGSRDIWAYAAYGRVVSQHGANPYVHRPAEYPTDPAVQRMAPGWRHSRSVYGPGFTALSAAGMAVAGPSALGQRLFFQLTAALAVAAALMLLWRARAGPAAMAWVGLNPALLAIVNGGHNDLLLGAAILAGVVALIRDRPATAGLLFGLGVLVKISALLPFAAVVAWVLMRRGWRPAARAVVAGTALIVGAYMLVGGTTALQPLRGATAYRSRASFWTYPASWSVRHLLGWSQHRDIHLR